jgi:hypothetical protein
VRVGMWRSPITKTKTMARLLVRREGGRSQWGYLKNHSPVFQKTRARNWEQGGRLPLIFPLWETLAAMFQADRRGHTHLFPTQSLTCSSRHHVGLKLIHHPTRAWLIPPFVSRWTWRVRQDVVHGEMGSGLEHTTYVEGKSTF